MKTACAFTLAALLAGTSRLPAADAVELNGITCLGDAKLACFLLYQPSATKPRNFTLAEGESKFGFKLLAVDAAGHQVLVEKCGVKKYVHINSTPDLIATDPPESAPAAGVADSGRLTPPDAISVASYLASDETARIRAGNPLLAGVVVSSAGKNSNHGSNTAPGAGNPGANSSTPNAANQNGVGNPGTGGQNAGAGAAGGSANSAASPSVAASAQNSLVNELWYQESLSIEQSRAMTADDVLSGKQTPFPRTPLTPASTPSQLIGQEVYFSDQIRGFKVTGYLNQ